MTIKLARLLEEIRPLEVIGETDKNIIGVHSDSRKVEKDTLFVAVRGVTTDGHKYIPVVASTHVGAIVCEELPPSLENGITYIKVADSAEALGLLASAWYGHPSTHLSLVGVTGTNGKTTTATLLYEMAKLEGYKAGLLSTVCNYVHDRAIPTTHTKRPIMAREAACRSDLLILTSDNPRNEDPESIIADMRGGLNDVEMRRTLCITDRREAIRTAIRMARPGEVVLVAGKGHEPYQEVCGVRHHFDDREEVSRELAAREA